MKRTIHKPTCAVLTLLASLSLLSCHESLEERASRECREFTERNCPQQLGNGVVYDSLTFDAASHTLHHYYSVTGPSDDARAFAAHADELRKAELEGIRHDVSSRRYKDAGYNFGITVRSGSHPNTVYFHTVFTAKELQ